MIWAILIGSLGYMFGASLEALIGQVKHYEKIVVLFIIIIGLGAWLLRRVWNRRQCEKINHNEVRAPRTNADENFPKLRDDHNRMNS